MEVVFDDPGSDNFEVTPDVPEIDIAGCSGGNENGVKNGGNEPKWEQCISQRAIGLGFNEELKMRLTYTPLGFKSCGSAWTSGSSVETSMMAMFMRIMSNLSSSCCPPRSGISDEHECLHEVGNIQRQLSRRQSPLSE